MLDARTLYPDAGGTPLAKGVDMSNSSRPAARRSSLRPAAIGLTIGAMGMLIGCAAPELEGDTEVGSDEQALLTSIGGGGSTVGIISPTPTTTTTTTISRTTATRVAPKYSSCVGVSAVSYYNVAPKAVSRNMRLSPVVNSTVACVQVETGARATCSWGSTSGVYIAAKGGQLYAQAGQTIGIGGQAGGTSELDQYVVASPITIDKLTGNGSVPCTASAGFDTAGTASGSELAGACVVETANAPTNATGIPNENYATLYVCAKSGSNTDAATIDASAISSESSSYAKNASVECYTGLGAGLNDISGTERDVAGVYLPRSENCHVVWNGYYEVPAAKRPATYGWPSRVNEYSTVLWRSVASTVKIAN